MRWIIFIVLFIFPSLVIGRPIRSSLGATHQRYSSTSAEWTNPYITEGLVALWDGEWNAGGGIHNTDSITWKDIVSGTEISFKIGPNADSSTAHVTALPNGIEIMGMVGFVVHSGIQAALNSTQFTIELVFVSDVNYTSSRYYILNSWRNSTMFWYWELCGYRSQSPWAKYPYQGQPCYLSVADNGGTRVQRLACQQYGINDYTSTGTDTANYYQSSTFIILGSDQSGYDFAFYGIVHTIRVYSRPLTATEIAANYAVDKERFGIP